MARLVHAPPHPPKVERGYRLARLPTCTLVWEARVVGYEVTYGAEYVPAAEDGYTVIVQKSRKITVTGDEPVICGSFKCGEPGKVVLTFDN
ncbi:hypothetical protein L1887_26549 [Cichorium endivia]|nr:hypothetical protein L1887_26549 [Cichorium endivia]